MTRTACSLLVVLTLPSLAFGLAPARGNRVGVVEPGEPSGSQAERMIAEAMPQILVEELRRAGLDARRIDGTIETIEPGKSGCDFLVEVIFERADTGYGGGVGAGVPVGSVGVGAEISMAYAAIDARVNVYESSSLTLLKSFDIQARTASPSVTGVGIGHREGFLVVHLPLRARYPHKRVARAVARDAATRIVAP